MSKPKRVSSSEYSIFDASFYTFPLALFRFFCGLLLAYYFFDHFKHTSLIVESEIIGCFRDSLFSFLCSSFSLGPDASVNIFSSLWFIAVFSSVFLSFGVFHKSCAFILLAIHFITLRYVFIISYIDDYFVFAVLIWLLLLPIRSTLSPFFLIKNRSALSISLISSLSNRVSSLSVVFFTLFFAIICFSTQIWSSNSPVWTPSDYVDVLVFCVPFIWTLGYFFRLSHIAVFFLFFLHIFVIYKTGLWFSNAVLFLISLVLFWKDFHFRFFSRFVETSDHSVKFSFRLSDVLSGLMIVILVSFFFKDYYNFFSLPNPTRNILAYLGFSQPVDEASNETAVRDVSKITISYTKESEKPVNTTPVSDYSVRSKLLMTYLGDRPWFTNIKEDNDRFTASIKRAIATDICRITDKNDTITAYVDNRDTVNNKRVHFRFQCDKQHKFRRFLTTVKPAQTDLNPASSAHFWKPNKYPYYLNSDSYIGSKECESCHALQFSQWINGAHGRAMIEASDESVIGDFGNRTVRLPGAVIACNKKDDSYYMTITSGRHTEEHRVDFVIGAGNQQQAYVVKAKEGCYRLLPIIWSRIVNEWLPIEIIYPNSSSAHNRLRLAGMQEVGCFDCHVGQVEYYFDIERKGTRFKETAVNCESCHGSGIKHKNNKGKITRLRNVKELDKEKQVRLCGKCHGRHSLYYGDNDQNEDEVRIFYGLEDPFTYADATSQFPSYQNVGLRLSRCYIDGDAKCTDCHTIHQRTDERNELKKSNDSCTSCHKRYRGRERLTAHSKHPEEVECNNCHMKRYWMRNDNRTGRYETNHFISVPRPIEKKTMSLSNACSVCHTNKQTDDLMKEVMEWEKGLAQKEREIVREINNAKNSNQPDETVLRKALVEKSDNKVFITSMLRLLSRGKKSGKIKEIIESYLGSSDIEIRQAAMQGVIYHSKENSESLQIYTSEKVDPIIRIMNLRFGITKYPSSEEQRLRFLDDIMRYSSNPPFNEIRKMAHVRKSEGKEEEHKIMVEMLEEYIGISECRY